MEEEGKWIQNVLKEFLEEALQGRILFTPEHTSDSLSQNRQYIFCGAAAMNGIPSLKRITIWLEEKNAFQNSWNILIGEKADWIYPAHGKTFRRDDLKNISIIFQR